jgi:hypothetical protein
MAELLDSCTSKSNVRLVVYHLGENHVECATEAPDVVDSFKLDANTISKIKNEPIHGDHAILAFDMGNKTVRLIDAVPEIGAAAAVLLCVVTELFGGVIHQRVNEDGVPRQMPQNVRRNFEFDAPKEEFGPKEDDSNINSWLRDFTPRDDNGEAIIKRRFHIGRSRC